MGLRKGFKGAGLRPSAIRLRSALRLVPPGTDGSLVPSVGDSSPSDSLFKASHTVPSHLPLLLYVVPCGGRVGVWRGRWAGRGGELSGRSSEVTASQEEEEVRSLRLPSMLQHGFLQQGNTDWFGVGPAENKAPATAPRDPLGYRRSAQGNSRAAAVLRRPAARPE